MKKEFITIKISRNLNRKIFTDDILYCKADRAYSTIKTHNEELLYSKSLKNIEELLKGKNNFVRISRSYIVNIDNCIELNNSTEPKIKLLNNEEISTNSDCLQQLEKLFEINSSETEIGVSEAEKRYWEV